MIATITTQFLLALFGLLFMAATMGLSTIATINSRFAQVVI
jgi:hypothetical protein